MHGVRPEPAAGVKYLTWTDDNLLRQVVYDSLREEKDPAEVLRSNLPTVLLSNIPPGQ